MMGDSWRLETVEVAAMELCDEEAEIAAVLAASIARRIPSLNPAIKQFYAELSIQLSALVAWRQEWIWHLDRLLDDVDDLAE